MDFVSVLDDCLARIGAGESVASCLERYSAEAHELAPLLAAAEQLHVLSAARLAQGQRLRAKVALRETLANQRQPVRPPFLSRLRGLPVATALAVVLFVGVAISAVASSQPGDLAYPVRVVVERAPVWVHLSNEGRATAELITAERRLDDVSESALHAGDVSPVALNALLQGVEAAVLRAERLPDEERAVLAARVSTQAAALLRLADAATDPETAARLRAVAQRVARAAGKLELRAPLEVEASQEPAPTLAVIDATATRRSTMAPGKPRPTTVPATVAATRRVEPTLIVPPAATVVASETPAPSVPDMTPIATPEVSIPQLTQTPRWPLPTGQTPQHTRTPRPRSTIVIPTIVVPTFVVPTIVVPTFVVPTIVVPTFVAPTPVVPSRQTRTPEPTGTASAAADPPTATGTPVPISTATAVSTMRPTRTPTVTVAPSLTATRYFSMPTATMTLTPTPTETSRFIPLLTATPTVSGPRATRTALANLTATVTATGTLTSTPTPRGPRVTAFAGTVTETPAWVPTGAAPTSVPPPVGISTRPPRPR